MPDDPEQYRQMMKYFWEAKGDIERYTGFDPIRMEHEMPHILHLWQQYKIAKICFDKAVEAL